MGPTEAGDYVKGLQRRSRSGWEQARLISDVVIGVLSGKDSGIVFPWEEEEEGLSPEEKKKKEDDELRQLAAVRQWAKEYSKRGGDK